MAPLLLKDETSLGNAEISLVSTVFTAGELVGVTLIPHLHARLPSADDKVVCELVLQTLALVSVMALAYLTRVRVPLSFTA